MTLKARWQESSVEGSSTCLESSVNSERNRVSSLLSQPLPRVAAVLLNTTHSQEAQGPVSWPHCSSRVLWPFKTVSSKVKKFKTKLFRADLDKGLWISWMEALGVGLFFCGADTVRLFWTMGRCSQDVGGRKISSQWAASSGLLSWINYLMMQSEPWERPLSVDSPWVGSSEKVGVLSDPVSSTSLLP